MQRELLEERTFSYVVEWCSTPDDRSPGVANQDECLAFDAPGSSVKVVPKSPRNNLYLYIPHSLLDPVLVSATESIERFYRETFWANIEVLRCCQAAQALAKRWINIDRCFIGISPGGVGQSLYSSHLDAMYGPVHAFFDPNIFYSDDELRTAASTNAAVTMCRQMHGPISPHCHLTTVVTPL
jgi:hypothetical protein